MQLLRYMVCIWTEYAREMEARQKGISKTKAFRYPPILPIVYYEGRENWTADRNLRDRIQLPDIFGEYFPDFTYKVVRIHDYTNEELLSREDEMSFLMMINRIQTPGELSRFLQVEPEVVKKIVDQAPPQILEIFAETIWSLCMKMNVPMKQAEECVKKVKERDMGYLFENMEKMDIQEERRKTQEARKRADEAEKKLAEAQKQLEEGRIEAQRQAKIRIEEERGRAIKNLVMLSQRLGSTKENTARELSDIYDLEQDTALKQVMLYWNE